MMHKEVIARKRTHVIAITLLLITFMLYVCEGIEALNIKNIRILYLCNAAVAISTILFILKEYNSCKVSYKYAIIADKFIINKLYKENETNLESIKLDNIVFLGKKCDIPKKYKIRCSAKYTCDIFGLETLYCIYKKNDRLVMFNFEPSKSLVKRIGKCNKSLSEKIEQD